MSSSEVSLRRCDQQGCLGAVERLGLCRLFVAASQVLAQSERQVGRQSLVFDPCESTALRVRAMPRTVFTLRSFERREAIISRQSRRVMLAKDRVPSGGNT